MARSDWPFAAGGGQVVGGHAYRSPIGLIDVRHDSVVDGPISLEDARAAAYLSVEHLLADASYRAGTGPALRAALHLVG